MGFSRQEYWSGLPFPSAQKYAMGLHMSSNKYPVGKLQYPSQIPVGTVTTLVTLGKRPFF